jgi:hypothetical protein
VDGCKAKHAGAGPLAVGTLNDPLKNDFGGPSRELFAAVDGVTTTVGDPVVHLGGGIDSERYLAEGLVRSAHRIVPSLCFCYCFTQADVAAAGFTVGQTTCM